MAFPLGVSFDHGFRLKTGRLQRRRLTEARLSGAAAPV
jgi:hypothetical protein